MLAPRQARHPNNSAVDKHAAGRAQRPDLAHGLLPGGARGRAEQMERGVALLLLGVVVVVVWEVAVEVAVVVVVVGGGQYRVAAAPRRHAGWVGEVADGGFGRGRDAGAAPGVCGSVLVVSGLFLGGDRRPGAAVAAAEAEAEILHWMM